VFPPALKDFEVTENDIVARDFNMILKSKEKVCGSIVRDPFKERKYGKFHNGLGLSRCQICERKIYLVK
jgi:hypothetical protein